MAKIETYMFPSRLYRYRSGRDRKHLDREICSILNCQLHFSQFCEQNDPMEGIYKAGILSGYSTDSIPAGDEEEELLSGPDEKEVNDAARMVLSKDFGTFICSFSEVRTNELMWAHYATKFEGFCISYRTSELLKYLPENVDLVRIYYRDTAPRISACRLADAKAAHVKFDPARIVLSCKNHRWLYEREWRLLSLEKGAINYKNVECVSKVYLGARMSNEAKKYIADKLRPCGIGIKEVFIAEYTIADRDY